MLDAPLPESRTRRDATLSWAARLKKDTHDLHKKLENTAVATNLMSSQVQPEDVALFIKCFARASAGFLSRCSRSPYPGHANIEYYTHKLSTLRSFELSIAETCSEATLNPNQSIAYDYVILGSELGSTRIRRHLKMHLQPNIAENDKAVAAFKQSQHAFVALQKVRDSINRLDRHGYAEVVAYTKCVFNEFISSFQAK